MDIYLNKDVIAVDQDSLGKQGVEILNSGGRHVLAKPLANGDVAVVLFNETSSPTTITTSASAAGARKAPAYVLHDLWSKKKTGDGGHHQRQRAGARHRHVPGVAAAGLGPERTVHVAVRRQGARVRRWSRRRAPRPRRAGRHDADQLRPRADQRRERLADRPAGMGGAGDVAADQEGHPDRQVPVDAVVGHGARRHRTGQLHAVGVRELHLEEAARKARTRVDPVAHQGRADRESTETVQGSLQVLVPEAPPSGSPWLSDLEWTSVSNGWGPAELDTSNGEQPAGDGNPITIGGVDLREGSRRARRERDRLLPRRVRARPSPATSGSTTRRTATGPAGSASRCTPTATWSPTAGR